MYICGNIYMCTSSVFFWHDFIGWLFSPKILAVHKEIYYFAELSMCCAEELITIDLFRSCSQNLQMLLLCRE